MHFLSLFYHFHLHAPVAGTSLFGVIVGYRFGLAIAFRIDAVGIASGFPPENSLRPARSSDSFMFTSSAPTLSVCPLISTLSFGFFSRPPTDAVRVGVSQQVAFAEVEEDIVDGDGRTAFKFFQGGDVECLCSPPWLFHFAQVHVGSRIYGAVVHIDAV